MSALFQARPKIVPVSASVAMFVAALPGPSWPRLSYGKVTSVRWFPPW
ncbi:hypothetical protein [Kitasatospora aureofaciens]|nr:hypothetical protein [Kitasatospora aureofaciens]